MSAIQKLQARDAVRWLEANLPVGILEAARIQFSGRLPEPTDPVVAGLLDTASSAGPQAGRVAAMVSLLQLAQPDLFAQ